MRASRAYEVKHVRGGPAPALLADPSRVDHVEVIELASGEVILFRDLAPDAARRVVRQLREDLAAFDADEFIAAWREADV
jgi:hypothetical protein